MAEEPKPASQTGAAPATAVTQDGGATVETQKTKSAMTAPGSKDPVSPGDPKAQLSEKSCPEEPDRGKWGSKWQFILTCVGYAVGLGNIWRFPKLAYDNGGTAFLIPYYFCAMFFGLPGLYFEYILGQYTQSGAPNAFKMYAPILQGVGWTMAMLSTTIAIYYNVIIAWVGVYLYETVRNLFTGEDFDWSSCRNNWNTGSCISYIDDFWCFDQNENTTFYFDKKCQLGCDRASLMSLHGTDMVVATDEFFTRRVLQKSASILETDGMNWPMFLSLIIIWAITCLTMMFGVKVMGYVAYVTATVPYVILAIIFVVGVTLPNAKQGIIYYLLKPEIGKIFMMKTWSAAMGQVCFSLSVGLGGLLSMSSYNDKNHRCFTDALIVVFADSFMSIFGGVAAFSIVGFLAGQQNKEIEQVLSKGSGPGLTFIVYPEAMTQMPHWLGKTIAPLFFIMLFLLGISSQFGLVEVLITSIVEVKPTMFNGKGKKIVCPIVCFVCFLLGVCMTFKSGYHWFTVFDNYAGTVGVTLCCVIEFVGISWLYGWRNLLADVRGMFGAPTNWFTKIAGSSGYYMLGSWLVISPIMGLAVTYFTFDSMIRGEFERDMPWWYSVLGWIIAAGPLIAIPILAINNYVRREEGQTFRDMFRPTSLHPSYSRIKKEEKFPFWQGGGAVGGNEDADAQGDNNNNNAAEANDATKSATPADPAAAPAGSADPNAPPVAPV